MPLVTVSINIPVIMWEKSHQYRINRSAIAREAIGKEIARIEAEKGTRDTSAKTAPGRHSDRRTL